MSESKLEMENKFNNVSNEEKNRQQKSDLIQKLFRVSKSDLIRKLFRVSNFIFTTFV